MRKKNYFEDTIGVKDKHLVLSNIYDEVFLAK